MSISIVRRSASPVKEQLHIGEPDPVVLSAGEEDAPMNADFAKAKLSPSPRLQSSTEDIPRPSAPALPSIEEYNQLRKIIDTAREEDTDENQPLQTFKDRLKSLDKNDLSHLLLYASTWRNETFTQAILESGLECANWAEEAVLKDSLVNDCQGVLKAFLRKENLSLNSLQNILIHLSSGSETDELRYALDKVRTLQKMEETGAILLSKMRGWSVEAFPILIDAFAYGPDAQSRINADLILHFSLNNSDRLEKKITCLMQREDWYFSPDWGNNFLDALRSLMLNEPSFDYDNFDNEISCGHITVETDPAMFSRLVIEASRARVGFHKLNVQALVEDLQKARHHACAALVSQLRSIEPPRPQEPKRSDNHLLSRRDSPPASQKKDRKCIVS